jgi:hypothetical protein
MRANIMASVFFFLLGRLFLVPPATDKMAGMGKSPVSDGSEIMDSGLKAGP